MTTPVDHQPTTPYPAPGHSALQASASAAASSAAVAATTPLAPITSPTSSSAPGAPSAAADPSATPTPAPDAAKRQRPPLRILLTMLHLSAIGLVGFGVLGMLLGWLGLGVGLLFVLGVGLIPLVGLVYALFGLGWFETQRVTGLYDLAIPQLRLHSTAGAAPGWRTWLRNISRQSVDGRMWRSVASFVVTSIFGVAMLGLVQGFIRASFSIFTSSSIWWQPGIIGVILCSAGMVGLALLHRIVAVAIVSAGLSEEELVERVRTSTQQREGAVRAADVERTRIERDLHDGVQPRLVSVAMTLGLAQQKIDDDPAAAKELVAEAHTSTKAAITELRQLARGIYASVLDDRGLDAALSALAARSHIPVQLDVRLGERCSRDAEAAIYFAIAESLTNAAKHSRASECRVIVRVRDEGVLWARVEDNGIGNARVIAGGGLDGVMNRVLAAGGTSRLDSPQGGPTTLEVSVPCVS